MNEQETLCDTVKIKNYIQEALTQNGQDNANERYLQSLIKHAEKHGITKAAIRYKRDWRQYFPLRDSKWKNKTITSLRIKSGHCPPATQKKI